MNPLPPDDGKPKIKTVRTGQSLIPSDYWKAWIEGQEEDGPYGNGKTESEAIADLKDQMEHESDFTDDVKTPPPLTPKECDKYIQELKEVLL